MLATAAKACARGAAQAGSTHHAMRAHMRDQRARLPQTVSRLVSARQLARYGVDRAAHARPRPSAAFGGVYVGVNGISFEVYRKVWCRFAFGVSALSRDMQRTRDGGLMCLTAATWGTYALWVPACTCRLRAQISRKI